MLGSGSANNPNPMALLGRIVLPLTLESQSTRFLPPLILGCSLDQWG